MSPERHSKQPLKSCYFNDTIPLNSDQWILHELQMIIHAFVSTRLDYCDSLFTCMNKKELNRLQVVQNSAVRSLSLTNKRAHITLILKCIHWLPEYSLKSWSWPWALHRQAPSHLSDLIQPYTPSWRLRSSGQTVLDQHIKHFLQNLKSSFLYLKLNENLPHGGASSSSSWEQTDSW